MNTIDTYNFAGKRAIIRVDFNVPLNEKFEVTDDTRIRAAIPTIKKVLAGGGSVILMSHLGRPKKNNDDKFSLSHIIGAVENRLGVKVQFAGDCMGDKAAEMAAALKPGEVMMLENLRFYAEEEGTPRGEFATEEEKKAAVKDFNFPKGLTIALLAGFMSGCFNVGLEFGKDINFGDLTPDMYKTLPATLLVTIGGFVTNAIYCLYQNSKNKTWSDYKNGSVWGNNLLFCALAGVLWYSQFFGLSLGKGFLTESPTLMTLAFCILMALNVTFSNVWGIILKEWKGCSKKTIAVLLVGIFVLIISTFIPELLK